MKTLVFFSVVLCALMFGSVSWKGTAASDSPKRQAVAEFRQPTTVYGVVLKGKYLFVHDDASMARGNACTFIYEGVAAVPDKLVTSFHCVHIERAKVKSFVLRTREAAHGMFELQEFQFGGETAAHGVPLPMNTAVVPIAN